MIDKEIIAALAAYNKRVFKEETTVNVPLLMKK